MAIDALETWNNQINLNALNNNNGLLIKILSPGRMDW